MNARINLDSLFSPASVAVVGASTQPGKTGWRIVNLLLSGGYQGKIFPVNPKGGEIGGIEVLSGISQIPDENRPLDLAVICLPAPQVEAALIELAALPLRAAIVLSAGFGETGGEGLRLEESLKRLAAERNIALLGPNSFGLINPARGLNVTFGAAPHPGGLQPVKPGNIAFFSQSGALSAALLDWAEENAMGFSSFVGLGNKAQLDESDIISHMGQDPETRVILGYLENVENGPKFLRAVQKVARRKPVILLRAGSTPSGARAASSHAGALNGSDTAYKAAFKKCGIIQASSLNSLFSLGQGFASQPLPKGPGLVVISNAGGPSIIAADACENHGLKMAELSPASMAELKNILPPYASLFNPIDAVSDTSAERLVKAARIALKDPAANAVLLIIVPTAQVPLENMAELLIPVVREHDKPVFCCLMGGESINAGKKLLREAGIPCYRFPEPAVEAISVMYHYNLWKHCPLPVEVSYRRDLNRARKALAEARAEGLTHLDRLQAQDLFKAYDMPLLETRLARNSDEAVQLAKQFGKPVALKIASPQISHKAEIQGVRLDLDTPQKVREAFMAITAQAARLCPDAYISGCMVQVMAPKDSRELVAGFRRDRRFGPMLLLAAGGYGSGNMRGASWRLAPLSAGEARSMLRELRMFPMPAGTRGQPPVRFNAIEDILLVLSQMAGDFPEIQEAECGPVLACSEGAFVADIKIVLEQSGSF